MSIHVLDARHPFFIGIGGIGISAIARMLLRAGVPVRGSDTSASHVTALLEEAGADITIGQSVDLIPADTDLVVYTIAIETADPGLMKALRGRGVPLLTYPQALGQLSATHKTIAVSGTHGKTTTTAMIGHVLSSAKKDPTVIVGSLLPKEKTNFIAGSGEYLVVEACEYRRSFLNLSPSILVITNIDNDHLDYYKDIDDIISAFSELAGKVPVDGAIVCDPSSPYVQKAIANAKAEIIDYRSVVTDGMHLPVPGAHNVMNAQAACAVASRVNIEHDVAVTALNSFSGTWRRFEYKGKTTQGALIYDDYGHHPTEIRATLSATRELFPKKHIVVAFQPHLYSRTKLLLDDFSHAFSDADRVILAPIYAAREPHDSTISSVLLAERILVSGTRASACESLSAVTELLRTENTSDDVIVTLGAGETNTIAESLVAQEVSCV
jgi:UDP-N-acetylmuramate--alanine ligase